MKTAPAILIAISTILLAGCVLRGKPAAVTPAAPQPVAAPPAPAPPPQPLSMPQTQVQLPPAQPVDNDALALAPLPEAPAEPAPTGRSTPRNRPRPLTGPATPPAAVETPVTATPASTEERGQVHELLSPEESGKLKNSADVKKREIRAWLSSSKVRKQFPNHPTITKIHSLLQLSDEAEKKGDIREASDLADRALVFMRELQK